MERSGTHWVAALLNSHPQIACFPSQYWYPEEGRNKIGSVHFFDTLASLEGNTYKNTRDFNDFSFKYNNVFSDLVPLKESLSQKELLEKFIERYSAYCEKQKGTKDIVGESSTGYVFVLPFMDRLYPNLKKICIVRDPKDRIVSWHFNQVRKGRKKETDQITEEFAFSYLNERIIPEYEHLLSYDGDMLVLSYEGLHDNPQKNVKKMLVYLGKTASDKDIENMIQGGAFKRQTEKEEGYRKEKDGQDYTSGLRKGIAGDWKNYIETPLAEEIDQAMEGLSQKVFEKYNMER
ncbi:hypothetical protein CL654_02790 [bacterium]|nr:hypothetical protein [bacterium]